MADSTHPHLDDDLTIDGTDLLTELLARRSVTAPAPTAVAGSRWTPPAPETPVLTNRRISRLQLAVIVGVFVAGIALGVLVAVVAR